MLIKGGIWSSESNDEQQWIQPQRAISSAHIENAEHAERAPGDRQKLQPTV